MKLNNFFTLYKYNTSENLYAMMHFKINEISRNEFIIQVPCYFFNTNSMTIDQPYDFNPKLFEQFNIDKNNFNLKFRVTYFGLLVFVLNAIKIAKERGYELLPLQEFKA